MTRHDTPGLPRPDPRSDLDTPSYQVPLSADSWLSGVRARVDVCDEDSVWRRSAVCAQHQPIRRELGASQLLSTRRQSRAETTHSQRTAACTFTDTC